MFTKRTLLSVVLLIGAVFTMSCQEATSATEIEKSIDKIFTSFNHPAAPGAAIAVLQDGEVVFKKGYGSANLEYDIPVTPETIYHVASVSKQFTVFSLLLLQEEGKLSLDDPIQKHIAEVPDFGHEITLRHLATHTSGMRDQWDLLNLAGWRWDDVITKEHVLKMVAHQKELNFTPGEQYMYCNTGFTLLAEVVARVSGKSFAEFTKERLFTPLKMSNSLFYDDHTKIVKNRAYSYYPAVFGFTKSVLSYANVGATSLFTTVEDLSRWAMNFSELKVGSAALVKQMNTLAVLNNGKTFGGAYGQFVTPYKGLTQIQHGGADAGYRSYLGRFPDQNFAVSVVANNGASNPGALAMQVVDLYLKDHFKTEEETTEKETATKTIAINAEDLKAFEGSYWDPKDLFSRKIRVQDGQLIYDRGNGNTTKLGAIAPNKFEMLEVPGSVMVEFVKKENNKHMTVSQDGEVVARMDAYTPENVASVDLNAYLGAYTSEELQTTYTFVKKEGKLIATHPRSSDFTLNFVKTDVFSAGGNTIVFTRVQNNITGLKVNTGRVKNLKFTKD